MSVERMKKLTVFATRSDTDALVRRLMHLRCVEIEAGEPEPDLLSLERFSCEEERLRLD